MGVALAVACRPEGHIVAFHPEGHTPTWCHLLLREGHMWEETRRPLPGYQGAKRWGNIVVACARHCHVLVHVYGLHIPVDKW